MTDIVYPSILAGLRKFILSTMFFFFPLLLVDKGLSGFDIGILIGVFSASGLIFSVFSGLASDRYSVRMNNLIAFFVIGLFFYFLHLANNFYEFLILFFIGGVAENLSEVGLTSYVLKFTKSGSRGVNVGFYSMVTIGFAALGLFVGGAFIFQLGFDTSLKMGAIIAVIMGLGSLYLKKNESFSFPIYKYTKDLISKKVIIYVVILFLYTLHWGAERTSYTLFLKENLSLNTFQSGIYMSIPVIILAITSFIIGRSYDRGMKFGRIAVWGMLLSGTGHVLMTYGDVYFSFSMRILHEIGDGIFFVYLYGGMHKYFPQERLGGNTGAILFITILGALVGSLIFGPVGELYGYAMPLLISGLVMLFTLVLVNVYKNEL